MDFLSLLYLVLLAAGVAWVIHRFRIFSRAEKEREARWSDVAAGEFRSAMGGQPVHGRAGVAEKERSNSGPSAEITGKD
jgi:hypothetical protein